MYELLVRLLGQQTEDNQGPYCGDTRVSNHCCNCDMRVAMVKLVNEVVKMKAEILEKINEFPKQV